MHKGYVRNETFAGRTLQDIALYQGKIGIGSTSGDYLFHGYRTSIIRYLIENQTDTINLASSDAANTNLCVHIADEADKASDLIADNIRMAVMGGVGEIVSIVGTINSVLDGVSVAGMVRDLMPSHNPSLTLPDKPSKFARAKDKALNKRIFVRISCYGEGKPGWHDLGLPSITFGDLAVVVNAAS